MIAATLFSGIGAPETAMPEWQWPWHAEIEPFPSAVLAARHPQSQNLGDVSAHDFATRALAIARPRVLVFGSPCQSFSVAGQRLGLNDPRGNLALHALRLVDAIRPAWFAFENVPGLLSSDEGRDFGAFLGLVGKLGYGWAYRILDAQFFGVAQRRRRVFVVGCLGDWRRAAAVLFEPESLRGDSSPRREKGKRVAATIESRADAGGASGGTDFLAGGGLASDDEIPEVAWALQERDSKGVDSDTKDGHLIVSAYRCTGNDGVYDSGEKIATLTNSKDPNHSIVAFTCKDHGADAAEEQAPTLRAMEFDASHANGGGQIAVAIPILEVGARTGVSTTDLRADGGIGKDQDPMFTLQSGKQHAVAFQTRIARNGRGQPDEVVPALNGADAGATSDMRPCVAVFKPSHFTRGKDGAPSDLFPPLTKETDKGDQDPLLMTGTAVRRLTPRECERLQGFPDDYTLVRYRGKPAKDGPRYKALGNSMAVPVLRWILSRIEFMESSNALPSRD